VRRGRAAGPGLRGARRGAEVGKGDNVFQGADTRSVGVCALKHVNFGSLKALERSSQPTLSCSGPRRYIPLIANILTVLHFIPAYQVRPGTALGCVLKGGFLGSGRRGLVSLAQWHAAPPTPPPPVPAVRIRMPAAALPRRIVACTPILLTSGSSLPGLGPTPLHVHLSCWIVHCTSALIPIQAPVSRRLTSPRPSPLDPPPTLQNRSLPSPCLSSWSRPSSAVPRGWQ
jgi:hypothetical protein